MDQPLTIEYYSDVLCVWAWIAQLRIDELNHQLGDHIHIKHHFVDVFGDVDSKMKGAWAEKGGYTGFAEHVRQTLKHFDISTTHNDIWHKTRPTTSANAHQFIKAVELTHGAQTGIDMAYAIRKAFFCDGRDISNLNELQSIAQSSSIETAAAMGKINDGSAIAALMSDYQAAQKQNIKGSPSYVIDGGRQTLYGNVGYRVLYANIHELLTNKHDQASWC